MKISEHIQTDNIILQIKFHLKLVGIIKDVGIFLFHKSVKRGFPFFSPEISLGQYEYANN